VGFSFNEFTIKGLSLCPRLIPILDFQPPNKDTATASEDKLTWQEILLLEIIYIWMKTLSAFHGRNARIGTLKHFLHQVEI
jgi:hypothetical protein